MVQFEKLNAQIFAATLFSVQLKYAKLVSWHERNFLAKRSRSNIAYKRYGNEPPWPRSFKLVSRLHLSKHRFSPLPPPSPSRENRWVKGERVRNETDPFVVWFTAWTTQRLARRTTQYSFWISKLRDSRSPRLKGFISTERKSVTWFSSTQNSSPSGRPVRDRDLCSSLVLPSFSPSGSARFTLD